MAATVVDGIRAGISTEETGSHAAECASEHRCCNSCAAGRSAGRTSHSSARRGAADARCAANERNRDTSGQRDHAEAGQRDLAITTYRTIEQETRAYAQAPTGIGKTLGTLFPLLKAAPGQGLDKLFFLSAKTPGRRLALDEPLDRLLELRDGQNILERLTAHKLIAGELQQSFCS